MRVLQVTEASGGGVRRHLRRVVPELRRRGLAVGLLMGTGRAEPDLGEDLAQYRALGCEVHTFRSGRGTVPAVLAGIPALRRLVRGWGPGVVHLHATRAGLFGRLALGGRGAPAVAYSPHAFVFEAGAPAWARWCGLQVERRLARRTAALVCVSPSEGDLARARLALPAERVHVIENGLEAGFAEGLLPRAAARSAWGIPEAAVLVGFCGRLAPQKDPGTLLRAAAGVSRPPGTLRLAMCGTGPLERRLRGLAASLGVADAILWLGYVPDLARRMAAFDLVALPSRYEGLSYTLLEALGAGVPVLAADIPANRLRDRLKEAVAFAPAGDPAAWARALHRTLAALPERRARAEALAPWVRQEFSAARQGALLADLYARLRGGPAATAPGPRPG